MQDVLSRPRPPINPYTGNRGGGNQPPRSQGIVIAAITLFALSGLLLGFAVGAFTRPKHTQTAGTNQDNKPVLAQTMAPKASPTVVDIAGRGLGCPILTPDSYTLTANNTVAHTLTAQAVDKSGGCQQGQPVYAPGITCKLWLVKTSDKPDVKGDQLTNINNIANAMPHEIQNGLAFDPATPQTQTCNARGQGKWKYGIASSVDDGSYYLVVLTDWQGKRYNWSWTTITVKKAD